MVDGWAWSVGTGGQVAHWAVGGGTRQVWSLGADDDVQAIDMVTARIGYVVTAAKQQGAKAGVFKTSDGGRHWTRKLTAAVDVLSAVKFRTTKLGWVAGRGGTVLKTVNAGQTWRGQDSWTAEALYGVDFVSTTTGWVVGGDTVGYCVGTTDGGKRWYSKGSSLPPLVAVDLVNATTGWVVGNAGAWPDLNGRVIRVSARGATWTDQSATVDPSPPDYGLVALRVVDAKHAYAGGQSEASLHTDDGALWHLAHIAEP